MQQYLNESLAEQYLNELLAGLSIDCLTAKTTGVICGNCEKCVQLTATVLTRMYVISLPIIIIIIEKTMKKRWWKNIETMLQAFNEARILLKQEHHNKNHHLFTPWLKSVLVVEGGNFMNGNDLTKKTVAAGLLNAILDYDEVASFTFIYDCLMDNDTNGTQTAREVLYSILRTCTKKSLIEKFMFSVKMGHFDEGNRKRKLWYESISCYGCDVDESTNSVNPTTKNIITFCATNGVSSELTIEWIWAQIRQTKGIKIDSKKIDGDFLTTGVMQQYCALYLKLYPKKYDVVARLFYNRDTAWTKDSLSIFLSTTKGQQIISTLLEMKVVAVTRHVTDILHTLVKHSVYANFISSSIKLTGYGDTRQFEHFFIHELFRTTTEKELLLLGKTASGYLLLKQMRTMVASSKHYYGKRVLNKILKYWERKN